MMLNERLPDLEALEQENKIAFNNLRSIVAALRDIREIEDSLVDGNFPRCQMQFPQAPVNPGTRV